MDATYSHTRVFMAPYHNLRYWLDDFYIDGKDVGREEVFNLCHKRLRDVIEHGFGVLRRVSQY